MSSAKHDVSPQWHTAGTLKGGFGTAFLAPAKINRFLHITGRRPDGRHNLQTVFQFLDLSDTLIFAARAPGEYQLEAPAILQREDNLCLQAARRLAEASTIPFGVRITLSKYIPLGGGLGGGSSDAATTLLALNHLFGLGFSPAELADLGLSLGADIPIFIFGHAAWAEGIGEKFTAVEPDTPWVLVIDPGVAVETATMFAADALTRDCHIETIAASGYERLGNVFEPVVRQAYASIDEAFVWFAQHGVQARLSGSGGCLFGLFPDQAAAQAVQQQAKPEHWRSWVVRLRNRSPLYTWND